MDYGLLEKRIENLETLCKQLAEALKAWQLMDSESGDKHPCPDYVLRTQYRTNARKVTESALEAAKKAKVIDG